MELSENAHHTPYVTMCDVTSSTASYDDSNVPSTVITCANGRPRRKRIIKFSESPGKWAVQKSLRLLGRF